MSRRIVQHELADDDLEGYSEYLRQRNPRAALRFLEQFEATSHLLAGMPGLGKLRSAGHPDLSDLRSFPITKFPSYLIFYRPLIDGIEILRVIHGARDLDALFGQGDDPPP